MRVVAGAGVFRPLPDVDIAFGEIFSAGQVDELDSIRIKRRITLLKAFQSLDV